MTESLLYAAVLPFEAARTVDILPEGHRSRNIHGHSFLAKVRASVPTGWAPFSGAETDHLVQALASAIAPLDYANLNAVLSVPTDENLARWIRTTLKVPNIHSVGVQCTSDTGVDLDTSDVAHLWRRYRFQSAHRLPNVRPGHKCGRIHGHGFEAIVHVEQPLNGQDYGVDYDQIDKLWGSLQSQLDFKYLNDIPGLSNPTSELIAQWIWKQLKSTLPQLSWVTVYETASCGAHFDGKRFRIWKDMTIDSAVQLSAAPVGDKRSGVHGHTFDLRLHINAALDEVQGWTVDFGDVKELFAPLFSTLDHHPLFQIEGLNNSGVSDILRFIRENLDSTLSRVVDRIDLYQTRGCGAILSWGSTSPALPI